MTNLPRNNVVPRHVAIIMDGNGRWATERGLARTEGHREGLATAKRIVAAASELGVAYLSLYTFSTENWKRAKDEVGFLMTLIRKHLSSELDFYRKNKLRVVHSGRREGLPTEILAEIDSVTRDTAAFPGMLVNLAINYGGRDEIIRAFKKLTETETVTSPTSISEEALRSLMDQPEIPDPDLIIRTGGEYRISNFLLWQSAYAELYFSDRFWPDFSREDLEAAFSSFSGRVRRYGGTV